MSHMQLCIVRNANETVAVGHDRVRGVTCTRMNILGKLLTLALLLRYLIHKLVS